MQSEQLIINKIEQKIKELLQIEVTVKSSLWDAMNYSAMNGGKRIRPQLAYAAGLLSNASEENLLVLGSAIELIHCYSLIHDDLPAMDNDDLRRGKPTCHKKYNEAIAILAGDALQAFAFEILSGEYLILSPQIKIKIINMLALYIGANGMAGGQHIDLQSNGKVLRIDELQHMHKMKTGYLIKGAILSGYLCGNNFVANVYSQLNLIADKIGLLFQIVDDILDVTSSTEILGKTANKDSAQSKATYVSIIGLTAAKQSAQNLYNEIIKELENISHSDYLKELTGSIYKRNS